ncbi:Ig-like domain-containing protein [Parasediminibacterium sp. JCM 36343]|uniref:Ig-like domain-containing protein n=1 Tax=Parasediminibacterium sp. JCM 36343 TaxID=3374279 RepID=UPI003979D4BD
MKQFLFLPQAITRKALLYAMGVLCLLLSLSVSRANAQQLVWQDNFDSASLNPNYWTYDFGDGCDRSLCGWGNSELEYYTSRSENVRIENGNLIIEARKETFSNSAFTSGRIKTEGRVHFKYGTLEARIKVPNIKNGLWPALWTLGTVGDVWPNIGEIDILEMGAQAALAANLANNRVSGATHWNNGGAQGDTVSTYDSPSDLSSDYHVYKMVWDSTKIAMYIDNTLYFNFAINSLTTTNRGAFRNPHFLLLNLAVGGAYTGIFATNGITATLPAQMYVDYIKLYQNPTDEISFGTNHAVSGNFGIFTETTAVADSIVFGKDATLNYWNNLTDIAGAVPFEGSNVLAVHAAANNWFGLGVVNRYVNIQNFATGSLKFNFKSSYKGQFKVGITSAFGQTWMNFASGIEKYGLIRDGNWHQVTIPIADFNNSLAGMNLDLMSIKGAFMFAGDPAVGDADFYMDNIYFSGGISPFPVADVHIISPANNAIFSTTDTIAINATAIEAKGAIRKVDFYNGTTLLGTDSTSPYGFKWINPTLGADTLTVIATDSLGAVVNSSPTIVFVSSPANKPPVITISTPANNASYLTPASISITVAASDTDGSIYKVAFYADSNLLVTTFANPYTFTWTGAVAGTYKITAKATDNEGATTISSPVTIKVSNPIKPTVSITSPLNNSSFTPPASIAISANAADANGSITKVDFYNGSTLLASDTSSPYSYTWNNVPLGKYTIIAVATDNDGNTTTSAPVAISVAPVACTGTVTNGDYSYSVYTNAGTVYYIFHPLATIKGCSSSILYLKTKGNYAGYNMTADGTDFTYSTPIAKGTATSFYFTYNVPSGGERNSSATPHTYLAGSVCVAGAPTVSITSPLEAASFTAPASITINADASDMSNTITQVSFYKDSTLLAIDTSSPYTFTWTGAAAGKYALSAKATNSIGLTTTSIPVNIVVNAPNTDGYCGTAFSKDYEYKAETNNGIVTFTFHPLAPIAGCKYALIYIRVGLTGGYAGYNTSAVGTDFIYTKTITAGTPISFYFTYNVPAGGENNSSANPHSYTVGTNCTGITAAAPIVSIVSPLNNASFTEPATIEITVNATDTNVNGSISKVDFFNGATLLGTDTSSPYTFNWTNVPAGNYTLSAKATNNIALSTFSALVNIVVGIDNSMGFCGTIANGDYNYRAESSNGIVKFVFHPLTPIAGCTYALIYIRQGLSGGYPGYAMTKVGQDFVFTQAIANGTPVSVYFTYNVPAGGERNSSATPHSFTAGTACTTLPVILSNYAARLLSDGNVAITWATATEQNNSYFTVEKSTDGSIFTPMATVLASNLATGSSYKVLDTYPTDGTNYYRLIQTDKDGKKVYLSIQLVNTFLKKEGITVYPNPLTGTKFIINLGKPTTGMQDIQLETITGKMLFTGSFSAQGSILPITLFTKPAAGVYLLRVKGYSPVKVLVQ